MTAGAGIVHSEMPAREIVERGGRMHGFQLWVNLPARDKGIRPRYQEISSAAIPSAESEDGKARVKVIAGEAFGVSAVVETRPPIEYLHFTILPRGRVLQPLPPGHEAFAYVFGGLGRFGTEREPAGPGRAVVFERDGELVALEAARETVRPLDVLLVAGQPLREPIARLGPFVMNTREEVFEAFRDFEAGRMGGISASVSRM